MLDRTIQMYRNAYSGLRPEVWYLAIVLLINRTGAMVIPFLTVYLTSQQGFTLSNAGLVMSSFGVGSLVGSYLGGWLTDRWGFYPVQQWTLLISGFLFWWVGQQTSFWGMCISIFFLSMVADAFRPANNAAVAHYSAPENRPKAYGLLRLAANLGFSMGPVMGGLLIASLGYHMLFWVDGSTCILAALAFRFLLPPKERVPAPIQTPGQQRGLSAYRHIPFLAFTFFNTFGAVAFMQFFSSLPVFLKEHLSYSESQIAMLIAINGALIAITEMPLVHQLGLRFKPLRLLMVGAFILGLAYLFLLGAQIGLVFSLAFILLLTLGEMVSMPFASTFTAKVAPEARRGEYMGLLSISWAAAFIVAPILGLHVAEQYGFSSLWQLSAGLCLISGLGMWGISQWVKRYGLPKTNVASTVPTASTSQVTS